jgi:hypothetical protein
MRVGTTGDVTPGRASGLTRSGPVEALPDNLSGALLYFREFREHT